MVERLALCYFGAVFAGLVAFAPPKAAVAAANRYADKGWGYSFTPPAGWKRSSERIPSGGVAFIGPVMNNYTVNLVVTAQVIGRMPLAEFVGAARKFAGHIKGVSIVGESSTKLGGVAAHRWRMRMRIPDHLPSDNLQVFCVHGGRAFVLNLSAPPEEAQKSERMLDAGVSSFRFLK